jgi:hypothetical protein
LIFSGNSPHKLAKVDGLDNSLKNLEPLIRTMLQSFVRT